MGAALVGGLLAAGWAQPAELAVVEVIAARRAQLVEMFAGVEVLERVDDAPAPAALIAVKPGDVPAAVTASTRAGATRILSIAAGVTLDALEARGR